MATPTRENNTSQNTNFGTGTTSGNTGTNQTPDKESKYEADLNGGTARVNSATTLADGVYTPDKFSWSGGTGKVSISCTKITVTGVRHMLPLYLAVVLMAM